MTGTADRTAPRRTSRRRFLGASAAGALAGVSGVGVLGSASARVQGPRTIELGGEIAGWQGRAPESIAGETNPTLDLDPGTTYRVIWENLDGMGHNFALLDRDGEVLQRTEIMSEEDETQSLEFTASEAMAEYVCEPHSGTMRGAIAVGDGSATRTETATGTPEGDGGVVPEGPTVALDTVADGFQVPTDFAAPPGDDRRFVVDLPGQVYTVAAGGRDEAFLDVSDRLAELTGERGLLGIAFHPEFGENRRFFLRYSAPLDDDAPEGFSHTERLSAFRATADANGVVPGSERVLLAVDEPTKFHNGGALAFGPDGYLYVSYGDGGGPQDTGPGHATDWYDENTGGNGQDVTENLLGSILRIDVDGSENEPYTVPENNPLVGEAGLDEQYAWGFRNPWRMGFSNGDLYVADVGQNRFEEVDRVVRGGNYGWNVKEGTHCYSTANPSEIPATCPERTAPSVRGGEPLRDPVIEYPHSRDGDPIGLSVIGGYVYENDTIPGLRGKYVFGDYSQAGNPQGSLFAATPSEEGLWEFVKLDIAGAEDGELGGYLIDIGRDDAGELYALTSGGDLGGAVHKLTPTASSQGPGTPAVPTTGTATDDGTTISSGTETETARTSRIGTGDPTATGTATTGPITRRTATTKPTTGESATTEPTTTAPASTVATATPTGEETPGRTAGTEGNRTNGTTDADGAGFGVLAALAGVVIVAARRLARQ